MFSVVNRLFYVISKLSDFLVKTLFNQSILRKCNHLTSVIPACRESFLLLFVMLACPASLFKNDSEQVGMTKKESLNLGYINFFKDTNANRYAIAPSHRTILNPAVIASIIVSIGARTDRQPFTAHAHGINASFFCPRSFIPIGKGMPIKNPRGIRIIKTIGIFNFKE